MTAADITATRHAKKGRKAPAAITERLLEYRTAARAAREAGDDAEAWRLLERTHVLSQPWVWPHIRSHVDMLRLAVHTRDGREILGQLIRTAVAGPGSAPGATRSATPAGRTSQRRSPCRSRRTWRSFWQRPDVEAAASRTDVYPLTRRDTEPGVHGGVRPLRNRPI